MQYLFIGILLGIVINMYIFPLIDTLFEIYTYKMTEIATVSKIKSESMAREYEIKYPEKEDSSTNVIGFHYDDAAVEDEQYDYNDEDEELNDCKNKIGFRIK